jgi:predicted amidohydrolase
MDDLRVTLIQADLAWEDGAANRQAIGELIAAADAPTDLIVLPEMFATGFNLRPQTLAETMTGDSVRWLHEIAAARKAAVCGSLMIREGRCYYNRLLWVTPDGGQDTYDKRHLFTFAGEQRVYTAGERPLQVALKEWQIRPMICYDLRFPVWTRNRKPFYDVAIFVANWPARRADHWRSLLKARAIENQSYVIGVNRVGRDGNGFDYIGDSMVVDPLGGIVFHRAIDVCMPTIQLEADLLRRCRRDFPALKDGDDFGSIPPAGT